MTRFLSGVLIALVGCSSVPTTDIEGVRVGATSRTVHDAKRDRKITFEIFYPAAPSAIVRHETHAWIYDLALARDAAILVAPENKPPEDRAAEGDAAPLSESGVQRRPVIVTSHGTGGSRWDFFWLAQQAVAAGYIVVSVEHPGDNWNEHIPLISLQVWERPRDVSFVLDTLADDAVWGSRLDFERVAAAGHSVGGFTVLGLAGLRYDIDRAFDECLVQRMNDSTCVWVRQSGFDFNQIDYTHSGDTLADERVRAVLAFSPAVAEAANLSSAAEIKVPVQIFGGRRDGLTPFELHAKSYAQWMPTATLTVLEKANHYVVITPCNAFGRTFITACKDEKGFDRRHSQRVLARDSLQFLERVFQRLRVFQRQKAVPPGAKSVKE